MLKEFEPIIKEIEGTVWNIEVHEVDDLVGEDHDVNAMYFKFASSNEEYFTYKIRFPLSLLTSNEYGLHTSGKRFEKGLDKAMHLFSLVIFNDYISTRHIDNWEDKAAERPLIKHSAYYK